MDTLYAGDLQLLSRREFLQWTRRGLSGLFALLLAERAAAHAGIIPFTGQPSFNSDLSAQSDLPEKGRALDNTLSIYSRPSFSAKLVNMYWRDLVFPINGVTIGDQYPEYNRVWYQVNGEGYAHSGKVQPVAVQLNKPAGEIPKNGLLAEVTVPFTDAVQVPGRTDLFAYRLYFSTTHWVTGLSKDPNGGLWYRIADDKLKVAYFVDAEHLRVLSAVEIAPISPQVPQKEKRLEVRLSEQVLVAYEGRQPVFMTRIASGGRFIDGDYSTPPGRYKTNRKRPSRHMASEDLAAPSAYDLPGVPWVSYLTRSGISFHGTYWHNDFGKPRSHGCINLSPQAARWVYLWSSPSVPYGEHTWDQEDGTQVDVI